MGYCIWKNKQVDISTTFCFSEAILWLTLVTILIYDEATGVPNSKDATLTILVSEADRTAYHEETIAQSHYTLQSEVEEVYKKNQERDKRELDLSKKPKELVAVDKIKELFPGTCRACGGAISLKQTISGAVLTLHGTVTVGSLASSDVLNCKK